MNDVLRLLRKEVETRNFGNQIVVRNLRGPILWVAETRLEGSDQTSCIRFRGFPRNKPAASQ